MDKPLLIFFNKVADAREIHVLLVRFFHKFIVLNRVFYLSSNIRSYVLAPDFLKQ